MSGPPSGGAGGPMPRPVMNGVGHGGVGSHAGPGSAGPGSASTPGSASHSNLNTIVIEYLSKKGYTKTEAMLRAESANQEVDPMSVIFKSDKTGPARYMQALDLFLGWVEGNLDIYKADLRRFLWPVFVYSFLKVVADNYGLETKFFFDRFKARFEEEHPDDLRALQAVSLPEHLQDQPTAKLYMNNKYRLSLSVAAYQSMISFLELSTKDGGDLLIHIIQTHLQVVTVDRSTDDLSAFSRQLNRAKAGESFPAEDEGIPGHNPGSANLGREAGSNVLTRVKLGPMPMEKDLKEDARADLEDEDAKDPPAAGRDSLVGTFDKRIKLEDGDDTPSRSDIPMAPSTARDVAFEVQKIKEERDRFKIPGRTGGVGPGTSVVLYTFHNTQDSINCLDFSDDQKYVAAGTTDSYARVWSLDGKAIVSSLDPPDRQPTASRRLIGHSGSIYAVAFSPAIASKTPEAPSTSSKYLLTGSDDKTIRLWSLETWTCLTIYKGHDLVVWDVKWNPLGNYFVSGSMDKTARMWRTDQPVWLRMFAGHEKDVDVVGWHPNGVYAFTASSDKTVRMWAISNGYCVRMYTGHAGNITSLSASPNGKLLASADDQGTIILWDLASGRLKKRMRGHARGGVWSLSWSAESTVIISAGADATVRVWDVDLPAEASAPGQSKTTAEGAAGQKAEGSAQPSVTATSKKKGKDVMVTPDQISAFPTKKTPVYKVAFTRQNLAIAGGCYLP